MRSSKFNEDFRCKQDAPQRVVKKSGILGHTAQVYTCKIFKLFDYEFLNSLTIECKQVDCQETIDIFEVKEYALSILIISIATFLVLIRNLSQWEFFVVKIPSQYILKRWTKEAKKGMMAYEQDNHSSGNAKEAEIVWRNSMLRIANTIISKN